MSFWGSSSSKSEQQDSLFGSNEEDSLFSSSSQANIASSVIGAVTPNESLCPSLSFKHRVIGFLVCAVLGIILSILGTILLIFGYTAAFAGLYSIGNVITLCSTGFLIGPLRQLQQMVEPTRIIATIVFFLALAATLVVAIKVDNPLLCIIFVIIQFLAFTWYSISYIPFAREAIIKVVSTLFDGL